MDVGSNQLVNTLLNLPKEKLEEIVNLLTQSLSHREGQKQQSQQQQQQQQQEKAQIQQAKEIQAQTIPKEAPVEDERIYKEISINPDLLVLKMLIILKFLLLYWLKK